MSSFVLRRFQAEQFAGSASLLPPASVSKVSWPICELECIYLYTHTHICIFWLSEEVHGQCAGIYLPSVPVVGLDINSDPKKRITLAFDMSLLHFQLRTLMERTLEVRNVVLQEIFYSFPLSVSFEDSQVELLCIKHLKALVSGYCSSSPSKSPR